MANKNENSLDQHPEVTNNAQDYFFYEKQPVIEEVVNRGDSREKEPKAYDITDKDMQALAKFALQNVDKDLLEDNRVAAVNSAVSMAVGTMDEGKWQSKVSDKTSTLLAGLVDKLLKPSEEKKIEDSKNQNSDHTNTNGQVPEEVSKTAAAAPAPEPPKKGVIVKLKPSGRAQPQSGGQTNRALSQMSGKQRSTVKKMLNKGDTVLLSSVVTRLDKVASSIQEAGMIELARSLDSVSNTLEKESFGVDLKPATKGKDIPGSDLQKSYPWLADIINDWSKAGPAWEPNPIAKKIQQEFLLNPANRDLFKDLWKREDHEKAVRLLNSILDTKIYYEELMKILDSYKDAPLTNPEV